MANVLSKKKMPYPPKPKKSPVNDSYNYEDAIVINDQKEELNNSISSNESKQEISKSDLINGVDYKTYKQMSITNKNKFAPCSFCQKLYDKGIVDLMNNKLHKSMLTTEYDMAEGGLVCFHCIFAVNYQPIENRCQVDGVYGKTVSEYVLECKDHHDSSNCSRACFICDHLQGIKIEGIIGSEELYQLSQIDNKDNIDVSCHENYIDSDSIDNVEISINI